eukprot:jgi/Chrzof1/4191/Cz14g02110.t1
MIWTRVTSSLNPASVRVYYQVSQRSDFKGKVLRGSVLTSADRDYTVKVDAMPLRPGTQYYYKFFVAPNDDNRKNGPAALTTSPVGKFRTPAAAPGGRYGKDFEDDDNYKGDDDKGKDNKNKDNKGNNNRGNNRKERDGDNEKRRQQLKYAVFSCSNWGWGYFNAYDAASKLDLDFWVHLGDYYYEYGPESYPNPAQAVRPAAALRPQKEIVALEDYRQRHSLYREDAGLQALSASAPLFALWDDHEITNNARKNSAQNHQPATEGDYEVRKRVSIQAYHEWMPTRDRDLVTNNYVGINYYRSYQFGDLATLLMTETRLIARSDEKTPGITGRVAAIVGDKDPDQLNATDIARLRELRNEGYALAEDPNYRMLGDAQLAWMESETKKSAAMGTTWTLYGFGTVLLETYLPDFEAAIAAKRRTEPTKAAEWEAAYRAVAYGPTTPTNTRQRYGEACYELPLKGQTTPVTTSERRGARTNQALGKYNIKNYYDAWAGFLYEKARYLEIASMANNAAQYGGDTHADWVGFHSLNGKPVVGEFSVGGVTSPSWDQNAAVPIELINEAMVAATFVNGTRRAYAGKKGFFLVTLDKEVHHTEYIHMTQCTTNYQPTLSCDFAYDWLIKSRNPGDVVPSACRTYA